MSWIDIVGYSAALAVLAAFLHEFDCTTAYRCDPEQRVVRSIWLIGAPVSRFSASLDFAPDKCFQADAR